MMFKRLLTLDLVRALRMAIAAIAALGAILSMPAMAAGKKVALIIGNSNYVNGGVLPNPGNDADKVFAAAQRAGFDAYKVTNLGRADFIRVLREFRDKADSAEVALLYYAGHAIEKDGVNWLLPVAHVLSPHGLAMISYNAMPGGHVRQIMREMLLLEVDGITDFEQKIAATRSFLEDYARPRDSDEPLATTLRLQAESMLRRPDSVLFHDELGECYHPQRLIDVVRTGEAVGLRHLTDAGRNRHLDGFLPDGAEWPEDPDEAVLREAMRADYRDLRYFRHTIFVRQEQVPERDIDASRIADLYLTTRLQRQEDGTFALSGDTIEIADPELAAALDAAAAAAPQRVAVSEIARTPEQKRVVLQLFAEWYVALYVHPAPFPSLPGPRPQSSSLVRAMLESGELTVCTLDHALLKIEQTELRALLLASDGSRTLAEVAAAGHGIPPEEVRAALTASAQRGLLSA